MSLVPSLLAMLALCVAPIRAGQVFGCDYDEVWYVRFDYVKANHGLKVFLDDGTPSDAINAAIKVAWPDLSNRLDKLFKDPKDFAENEVEDWSLILDGLVFYKRGRAVMTIIPNHAGWDIVTIPNLWEAGEPSFSAEQLAQFDQIAKETLAMALPIEKPMRLPKNQSEQVGAVQPATRSESKSKAKVKPKPESEERSR
jgi:hypothetical protein